MPDLVAVLPLAEDMGRVDGRRLQAIAAGVWSDGVVLRWAVEPGPADASLGAAGWSVTDDVGTAHRRHGSGAHGDDGSMRNEADWRPGPPASARSLTIVFSEPGGVERLRRSFALP